MPYIPYKRKEYKKLLQAYHNPTTCPIKMDVKLYMSLLRHRSHTGSPSQAKYARWLRKWILANVKGARVTTDFYGNILVTKGKADFYPAFASHMDINQDHIKNFTPIQIGQWILGVDEDTGLQVGCGHDDKAGNLAALQMPQMLPACKAVFTTDEECGGIGADGLDL